MYSFDSIDNIIISIEDLDRIHIHFPSINSQRNLINVSYGISNSNYIEQDGEIQEAQHAGSFSSNNPIHWGGDYYSPYSPFITTSLKNYRNGTLGDLLSWDVSITARDTSWTDYSYNSSWMASEPTLNSPNGSFNSINYELNEDLYIRDILIPENEEFEVQAYKYSDTGSAQAGIYGDWEIDRYGLAKLVKMTDYEDSTIQILSINGTEFTFKVLDINEDPTNLLVSESTFDENKVSDSAVATLSTSDPDSGDTHTYSLISGNGDTDNSVFTIEGDQLKINASPDYETQNSYSVRLQTTDSGGLTFEKSFTLSVNDLDEGAPDLDGDGFVDGVNNYQMWTSSGGIDLTNKKGRKFSDDTSKKWDAIKAIQTDSGFSILLRGDRKKQGKFQIVSANENGVWEDASSWKTALQMFEGGYEDIFDTDFNDNGQIGFVAPTEISLSSFSFNENISGGSVVSNLSSTDLDPDDTHTYSLVGGAGDTDNSAFTIDGNQLKINESPDFETQDSYSVRLQTEDSGGLTFEKSSTLTVNDLEEGTEWDQITEQSSVTNKLLSTSISIGNRSYSNAILGTSRKDKIKGTSSDDIIAGGATKDQLKGGSGADAFVFNTPGGFGNKQMDVITDFSYDDDDTLVLLKDQFSSFKRLSIQSAKNGKHLKKLASSSGTMLLYLEKSGKLYYNENGSDDGFGDGGVFVKLKGSPYLDGGDFTFV